MREVKFKGKSKETGNWVYGCLAYIKNYAYLISFDSERNDWNDWIEVDIETVGQYTELLDKNNNEIYEGDIVTIAIESNEADETVEQVELYTGEVCFDNGYYVKTDGYCPSLTHYHKLWIEKLEDNLLEV